MRKSANSRTDGSHLSETTEKIRETLVRRLKEQRLRTSNGNIEAMALLSADEAAQLNSAVETLAARLGIGEELATIDTLLHLRITRVARILSAAFALESTADST